MTSDRTTFAKATPIQGPWQEPVRGGLPVTVPQTDPRTEVSEQALVLASQNAFPIVATQKSRRDGLGLAAGAAVALVLGAATFMSLSSSRHSTSAPAGTAMTTVSQVRQGVPTAAPLGSPVSPAAVPTGAVPVATQPMIMPGAAHAPTAMTMPGMAPGSAPVLVYDGSTSQSAVAPATAPERPQGAPAMLAGGMPGGSAIGDNNAVHATRIGEQANTVVQGTLIAAVLETAIDTDVPGYARAVVSQDVRSFDGSRVLIPRSSRLIGEYKGVTQAGQRRAFLMWTRLVRPDGVSVALASPAADVTGQAGVGGQVNSHFLSRFGSSILLSILGGAGSLFTGGASTVVVSGGNSAASVAAQHDGNRPPTIRVRQGEPIKVFTARDLIFNGDGANG
jgi:type IV secretion system protein VirB10